MSIVTSSPADPPAQVPGNLPAPLVDANPPETPFTPLAPLALEPTIEVPVTSPRDQGPLAYPSTATSEVLWQYVGAFVLIHLAACLVAVPWLFSWFGVASFFVMHYFCATIGTSVCFHRMLSHRAFKSPKWLEYFFVTCGVCSLQDSPIRWVATHRRHHQYTDAQDDPHSPLVSFTWGHVEWVVVKNDALSTGGFYDKYARDLLRDPYYFFLERNWMWLWVYVAHALLIFGCAFGVGYFWTYEGVDPLASGLQLGLSALVWGVALRTVYGWHSTWAVNSVGHLWGYRNYETDDHSTNHPVLGVLASGEGWHNNHHADPRCAKIGHRWWELDPGWWTIAALECVGLATEVVAEPRTGRDAGEVVGE